MTQKITIWHNNRCSTSRKVFELLKGNAENIEVRDYVANPPDVKELQQVLKKMKQKPEYILRKKEHFYKEEVAGKNLSDDELMKIMSEHPILIERPIIIINKKAWLGRPPEEFEKILLQEIK